MWVMYSLLSPSLKQYFKVNSGSSFEQFCRANQFSLVVFYSFTMKRYFTHLFKLLNNKCFVVALSALSEHEKKVGAETQKLNIKKRSKH